MPYQPILENVLTKKKTEWFEDLSALQEILGNRYNDRIRVDL